MKLLYIILLLIMYNFSGDVYSQESYTLHSDEGKFTIEFPAEPEFKSEPATNAISKIISYKLDMIERDSHLSVKIVFISEAVIDIRTYLKTTVESYANKYHGELNEILELNIDDNIGYEADIKLNDKASLRVRIFYKGSKLYEVMAICPAERKNGADINNFLNSFVIDK